MTIRIPSGTTDQYVYFVAVDSTDFATRETGLSSFTVYRSRNGAAAAAMTTPTINEVDATNMPGVYELLLDEDMTIGSGNDSEAMAFHITQASMAPVTLEIELYRPKITVGNTLGVAADGDISGNVDGAVASVTGAVGSVTGNVGGNVTGSVGSVLGGIDTSGGTITTLDGLDTAQDTQHTTTQDLIGNISAGSAGVSTTAASFTKSATEPETNTYTATQQLDGVYHIVEDVASTTDAYYQFDVGPNGAPVEFEWVGYAQGNNSTWAIYAYNYGTTSYEQVGTITGTAGTTVQSRVFSLTVSHVGTGANDGLVRFRFLSTDGTAIATDRLFCTYTVISAALGYENGGVWVDEVAGTSTGTTPGVDGLITNRSDDFDNAQTIAEALGYTALYVTNGNSITLSDTINDFTLGIIGGNWDLALGGQDISGCDINDADITGIATGSTSPHFHNCLIGAATLPPSEFFECGIGLASGTLTLGSAGAYRLIRCYSDVPGAGAPTIDMGAAVGATTLELRDWRGGITLNNLAAGDVVTLDGIFGTITLNGADASVEIRGIYKGLTNNLTGAPSVNVAGIEGDITSELATVDGNVDAILVDTNDLQTNQGNWLTATTVDLNADQSGVTVGTVTTNTDMRGTDNAATAASLATAQTDLDTLTGTDGATLATSQPNYAPATAAALTTHDGKLDTVDSNVDSILADTGTDGVVISAATANQIADALLLRDMANVDGSLGDHMLGTAVQAILESAVAGSTWTIYQTNGTTAIVAKTVTTDAAADPITGVS